MPASTSTATSPPPDRGLARDASSGLWPHQEEAIELACKTLGDGGRATEILACGTGKTRIGAHIAAVLASGGRRLVLAPTVTLLAQLLREYRQALGAAGLGRTLAVCAESLETAGQAGIEDLEAQHIPVTTDPRVIAQMVSGSGPVTVASTYQSLDALHRAHRDHAMPAWDVVVLDEAHHTVGGQAWSKVHHDDFLPAQRRLYMTATPRVASAKGRQADLIGMDDERVYGPTVYRLGYAAAIELKLLARYRVVVSVVTNADIRALTDESHGRTGMRVGNAVIPARMLAAQIAILRAATTYGITRAISYHSRVAEARHFAATFRAVAEALPAGVGPARVWAEHLSGEHPPALRHTRLAALADGIDDGLALISNARLLGEGVDVPAVDSVVFTDPKYSVPDIIQAVGRAVRLGGRTDKIATIIVPVLAEAGTADETAIAGSAYATIWQVVLALRSHDEDLAAELDQLRREGISSDDREKRKKIDRWLHFDGVELSERFIDAVKVRMVESATSSWDEFYGAATAYANRHGNLLPNQLYVTDRGLKLGAWLNTQRALYKRGILRRDRARLLEGIGMVWSPLEAAWEQGFLAAIRCRERHGHINMPVTYVDDDGFEFGRWLATQRSARRYKKNLSVERARRLEELGIVWEIGDALRDERWKRGFSAATRFREENGHLDVVVTYVTGDGFALGRWLSDIKAGRAKISPEQRDALTALGMIWTSKHDEKWERGFAAAAAYRQENGHLNVPEGYVTSDGFRLSAWIKVQRSSKLTPDRRRRLDELGMIWSRREAAWADAFAHATEYARVHGHLRPPAAYRTEDDFALGTWLLNRRNGHCSLTKKQRTQLDALDPNWANTENRSADQDTGSPSRSRPKPAPGTNNSVDETAAQPYGALAGSAGRSGGVSRAPSSPTKATP